ncbi:MAG: hypothetical protein ABGZ17_04555 [Planctomycetaceae bacterium]
MMVGFSLISIAAATVGILACGVVWGRRQNGSATQQRVAAFDSAAAWERSHRDVATCYEDGRVFRKRQPDWGQIASTVLLGWSLIAVLIPVGLSLQSTDGARSMFVRLLLVSLLGGAMCGVVMRLRRLTQTTQRESVADAASEMK